MKDTGICFETDSIVSGHCLKLVDARNVWYSHLFQASTSQL